MLSDSDIITQTDPVIIRPECCLPLQMDFYVIIPRVATGNTKWFRKVFRTAFNRGITRPLIQP
jgi:hypothetical protein